MASVPPLGVDFNPNFRQGRRYVCLIIPLHFHDRAGDSVPRVMLLSPFPKKNLRFLMLLLSVLAFSGASMAEEASKKEPVSDEKAKTEEKSESTKKEEDMPKEAEGEDEEADPDDEAAAEKADAEAPAVARPVAPDPVQVYGWREEIFLDGIESAIDAKLDTGAYTSSIHAEEKELFERDGKKWLKFIVTEPRKKDSPRVRIEAPLVRIARIKEPGGESEKREVVRLAFKIGDRKLRGDFTLNDRSNMLSAVLIGRTTIRELGWIDPSRTNLATKKIMR